MALAMSSTAVILMHLALWAEIGVLTRVFFSKFFVLGCSGQWGPCLTGGTYYGSLPANLLGSFVMGSLGASSVLGLKSSKEVTILPKGHAWQSNLPLHIGLRTGFCGSLTTFGTWQVELMTEAIAMNKWVNAGVACVVGLAASLMAYIVGCHLALAIDRYWLTEQEDVLDEAALFQAEELAAERGRTVHRLPADQEEELQMGADLPRTSGSPRGKALSDQAPAEAPFWARLQGNRTHIVSGSLLLLATAGWAVGAGLETEHTWLRNAFFSALLGIPGCWLRWALAMALNYRLESRWPWYPGGTLAANMLGTATSFAMAAAQARAGLGYWGMLLTGATQTGFCGALTTVSTLVAEIVKFSAIFPDNLHAYSYTLHTLVGGALLGISLYGWTAWD